MIADCTNLLDQLLLVNSRGELDVLIDTLREYFTRTFVHSAAQSNQSLTGVFLSQSRLTGAQYNHFGIDMEVEDFEGR